MKYLIYSIVFINWIYAQQNTYFNILPDLGALENKSIFKAVTSDNKFIYTLGSKLTAQDSNRRNQVIDIQYNAFDYNGVLRNSKIIQFTGLKPYIQKNFPFIKMNDSLYFYILYLEDRQKIWTDFEALILNIKNGKVEKHLGVPRPFPGDYDFNFYSNTSFVNEKLNLLFKTYYDQKVEYFIYTFNDDLSINKIRKLSNINDNITFRWLSNDNANSYELVGEVNQQINNVATGKTNLFYIKLDSNLNLVKRNDYTGSFNIGVGTATTYTIIRNEDRSFVISANDWVYTPTGFYGKPVTLKFSPEFDTLIWRRYMYQKFDQPERQRTWINFNDKMKDNSGYITCGDQYDQRQDSSDNYAILYKVSEQGDSLWFKKYLPLAWDKYRAIGMNMAQVHVTDYNSIVFCGSVGDRFEQNTRAWLLHLDSGGCLVPGCNEVVSTKDINHESNQNFKIYPNPVVSSHLNIACFGHERMEINLELLSLSGQIIRETKFKSEQGLQIQLEIPFEIPNGEYLLRFTNGSSAESKNITILRK